MAAPQQEVHLRIGGASPPETLAQKIRAKYPGVYDDLDDQTLEDKVRAKYPGVYDDLPRTPAVQTDARIGPAPEPRTLLGELGAFLGEATQSVNPRVLNQALQQAFYHPLETIQGLGAAQGQLLTNARAAYQRGDRATAAREFLNYLLPIVGPRLSQASEFLEAGDPARGLGAAVDVGIQPLIPQAAGAAARAARTGARAVAAPVGRAVRRPFTPQVTPKEAAALAFVEGEGVPLDLATATGTPWIQQTQALAEKSPGGAVVAGPAKRQRTTALTDLAERLRERVSPGVRASGEEAGAGVQSAAEQLIKTLDTQADEAYTRLREIEADPAQVERVQTAPRGSLAERDILRKLAAGNDGVAPTPEELAVLRQIEIELDAQPFTRYQLREARYGGSLEHVEGTGGAGAGVYHDILQAAPGTTQWTRGDVLTKIRQMLETGEWNDVARGAWQVARQRLARSGQLTGPTLPPGTPLVGTTVDVPLPVVLHDAKRALAPLHEDLVRQSALGPLQGDTLRAARALDRLMRGPDVESVSIVDAYLSDLKAMARPEGLPELRTRGQGLAAAAVKNLERAVQQAVAKAGPEAVEALQLGRAAVREKYDVAGVMEGRLPSGKAAPWPSEPGALFKMLTGAGDTQLGRLREVARVTPSEIPKIADGYLQGLIEKATAEGGFGRAAGLWADWQRLGVKTKALLFGDQVQNLDHFFLAAKRFADNPNPSGTAYSVSTLAQGGAFGVNWLYGLGLQLGAAGLVKLMHSPRFVRAMTRAMSVTAPTSKAPAAVRAAATAQVIRIAKEAGVPMTLPAAAEGDQERIGR